MAIFSDKFKKEMSLGSLLLILTIGGEALFGGMAGYLGGACLDLLIEGDAWGDGSLRNIIMIVGAFGGAAHAVGKIALMNFSEEK